MANYSIDPGNRFIKCLDKVGTYSLPSIYTELVPGEELPELNSFDSAVLEYLGGPMAGFKGRKVALGKVAEFALNPVEIVHAGKADQAILPLLILASIRPTSATEKTIKIDTLYTCLVDPARDKALLTETLVGVHKVTRNGRNLTIDIQSVEVKQEGHGEYLHLLAENQIEPTLRYGMVNFGGGDINAAICTGGFVMPQSILRLKGLGTLNLAHRIANDPSVQQFTGGNPNPRLIMDSIHQTILTPDHGFQYGRTGNDFREAFDRHLTPWLKEAMGAVMGKWGSVQIDQLECIYVTGGSAHLVELFLKANPGGTKLFRVIQEPQWAPVKGLAVDVFSLPEPKATRQKGKALQAA